MYVNKCIKCSAEFETKNPKRVICPNCLYAEKKTESSSENLSSSAGMSSYSSEGQRQGSYSFGQDNERPRAGYQQRENGYSSGGYQRRDNYSQGGYSQGGYQRRDNSYGGNASFGGGYSRDNNRGGYSQRPQQGGYSRDNSRGGYSQRPLQGGYNRDNNRGGYSQRPQQGGYNRDNSRGGFQQRRPQGGNSRFGGGRKPQRPQKQAKPLLVTKEQLEVIEALYKTMLPLPNPDAHEVIGEKMQLEPRKVFFGINLVRQKLMLPKLPYPKRKLAISEDQMLAIKSLYEPLLPLPPIGCHKIIATQLRMDEWRVHVGIGLIRAQMGLERWNQDREDAPEEYRKQKVEETSELEKTKSKKTSKKKAEAEDLSVDSSAVAVLEAEDKKSVKKSSKKKVVSAVADVDSTGDEIVDEEKPKKTRVSRKKKEEDSEVLSDESVDETPKKKRATRKSKKDEE